MPDRTIGVDPGKQRSLSIRPDFQPTASAQSFAAAAERVLRA
jgi:hypothetical protein